MGAEEEGDLVADEGGLVGEVEAELGLELLDDAVDGGDGVGVRLPEHRLHAPGYLQVRHHPPRRAARRVHIHEIRPRGAQRLNRINELPFSLSLSLFSLCGCFKRSLSLSISLFSLSLSLQL